jgi:1-acyl-sn-glycerol-3-phosphate acyltransferase
MMIPTLPAALPRRGGPLSRMFGRLVLRMMRWRITGEIPNRAKLIIIAAPHRSNWDFVIGIAAKFALGVDASWLGKHTLFRGPAGWLFRRWGGIPVDRRSAHHVVSVVVSRFRERDSMVLGIAPEGTRKPGSVWKTGFWHIADQAGVTIMPVVFDWKTRTVRILPEFRTTTLEADLARLKAQYESIVPGSVAKR